jgi:hypothetical protein
MSEEPKRRIKATYATFATPPDLEDWNLNSLNLKDAIEAAAIKLSARAANEALSTLLKNDAYVYFSETKDDPLAMSLTIDDEAQFEFVWQFSFREAVDTLKERMKDYEANDEMKITIKALRAQVDELEQCFNENCDKGDEL